MKRKYNIPVKTCGVYKIENKITGEIYVGASVDVAMRLSTHFGRDAKKYAGKHHFYDDILKYGKENFNAVLLEKCNKENLLEQEQYYYDLLQPTYNKERPHKAGLTAVGKATLKKLWSDEDRRQKQRDRLHQPDVIAKLKAAQKHRMKAVIMIGDNGFNMEFENMCDAQKWLDHNTKFTGKNKVSKIKAVCDGDRQTAFGYKWKYKEV